jgi:hypothetical protein
VIYNILNNWGNVIKLFYLSLAYSYVPDSEISETVHTIESEDENVIMEEEEEDEGVVEEGAPRFTQKLEPIISVQDGQLTMYVG